jgi:putative uncharacterized protein (fragment)
MLPFWQYTHFSPQPEKNTAPEPAAPERHGSSQKCRAARATRSLSDSLQKPAALLRSMPHRLGQSVQWE